MKIQIPNLFLLALLLTLGSTIYLPLNPKKPRCMMVYTIGEVESVKIFMNLPQLPSQGREQHYQFTMRNTQTQQTKTQTIQNGNYNKQFDLSPNIIYEVCIMLYTNRPMDNIVIYYKAQTVYNIDHGTLKVPENLLKKEDFKGTYVAAAHIEDTVKEYKQMQKARDISSNQNFEATNGVDKKLIIVSIVEIIIILAAGIYQYISLQNYLTSKQYI